MRNQSLRSNVRASLVLLSLVLLLSTVLSAGILGHFKSAKHKQTAKPAEVAKKNSINPLMKRRAETIFSRIGSGEPEGAPNSYAKEQVRFRAYPGSDLPIELSNAASNHFARVKSESQAGQRGQTVDAPWTSIGPSIALYPEILNRTAAPYVASGRISALAIEHHCAEGHCRLYVGAAGGGIWRTNNALDNTPSWTFISGSFATNAIGAITIDPTDSSGDTIYVGTGEPNASGDSGAGQGIYKSTDGGESWSLVPGSTFAVNRSIGNVVIDPTNPNTMYVGITRGVRGYSAVTGGATGNPPPGTGATVGLYKSVDGGNSFTLIYDSLANTPGGFSEGVNTVALDPTNP